MLETHCKNRETVKKMQLAYIQKLIKATHRKQRNKVTKNICILYSIQPGSDCKKYLGAVIRVSCWATWSFQSDHIFNRKEYRLSAMFAEIKPLFLIIEYAVLSVCNNELSKDL